jgi:hypothetical protein
MKMRAIYKNPSFPYTLGTANIFRREMSGAVCWIESHFPNKAATRE